MDSAGSKKRGRPPLPRGTSRECRIVTFVTPGEMELLNERAEQNGVAISGIVYKLIRKGLESENTRG